MRKKLHIVHIVPRLRPTVCGVGDYALNLATEWRASRHITSRFIVTDPGRVNSGDVEGFEVNQLGSRTTNALLAAIEAGPTDMCVLHYSGYGYQKRGAPFWLAAAVRQIPRTSVCTMFHELYAWGAVHTSAFWLSFLQQRLAIQLAKRSAHVVTNRQASADWLVRAVPTLRERPLVIPVFSCLGEPQGASLPSQRAPWLAVFGYQAARDGRTLSQLSRVIKNLKVERVVSMGRPVSGVVEACGSVPFVETGVLSADSVSEWLGQCRYGFTTYHPDYLGKSSILAALFAHRICAVLETNTTTLSEGLEYGEQLACVEQTEGLSNPDEIATKGFEWYSSHNLKSSAEAYIKLFTEPNRAFAMPHECAVY